MRIAAAQLDLTVGDVEGNLARLDAAAQDARAAGATALLTPEMSLLGYPPRDLVLRQGVAEACERAAADLARRHPDLLLLLGLPRRVERRGRRLANSIAICRAGRIEGFHDKRLLPTYDVFDEDRWFAPGDHATVVEHQGERLGLLLCEDLWGATDVDASRGYELDPVHEAVRAGATALLVASATPFVLGKRARQAERLSRIAAGHGVPVLACNQVGANDDLIFDGGSSLVDAAGRVAESWPLFESATRTVDLRGGCRCPQPPSRAHDRDLIDALVVGIRGYFAKTGHVGHASGESGVCWSVIRRGCNSCVPAAGILRAVRPANPWRCSIFERWHYRRHCGSRQRL